MNKTSARHKLPSLKALRAFEAASRHSSFTRAAEELNVTQGAVSRHIHNLELDLGNNLFQRNGRNVVLTAEGIRLKSVVGDAFDRLSSGIESVRVNRLTPTITVSLLPSLAAKWLAPQIGKFVSSNPKIEIQIHCSRLLSDLRKDEIDVAIRYGRGDWAGCRMELLMRETLTPVCAPIWLEKLGPKPSVELLLSLPLLHGDIPERWHDWFASVGITSATPKIGPVFTDDNALIQAAIDGQGIVLGRSVLVAQDLAAGRLVAPFKQQIPAVFSYWLVTDENKMPSPLVFSFCEFLKNELAPN